MYVADLHCLVADLGGVPRVAWSPFGFSCDRNLWKPGLIIIIIAEPHK